MGTAALRNNGRKCPKVGKRHKPTDPKGLAKDKQDKPKEIHKTQLHFCKLKTEKKILKAASKTGNLIYRGKKQLK